MAGIVGQYLVAPRFRNIISCVTFPFNGTNPVDVSPQRLPNQRGQVMIQGTSVDNGFTWSFNVQGGIGEWPSAFTRDFYFVEGTNVNCTVATPAINTIVITTPAGDAGGRTYVFQFFPTESFGPTIEQTSGNVLTDDLIVKLATTAVVPC